MAGVTLAKYLRLWSGKTVDVTLVTPSASYISNIMSNLVVTGQMAYSTLQFNYTKLASNYGVKVVNASVTGVSGYGDQSTGQVTLSTGATLTSERLVLAPGISMDEMAVTGEGTTTPVLHAWQAGTQTTDLQKLLAGMPRGGRLILTIPPKPYRCPPGPYERACVIADYFLRNNTGSKIIVLDANDNFTAEPVNFGNAFRNYFNKGALEYWPSSKVLSVTRSATPGLNQTITYDTSSSVNAIGFPDIGTGLTLFGHVVNIIAPHRAPAVARIARVLPASASDPTGFARFAPVDVLNFESTLIKGIHVIGDASDTSLPKAGHVANQEAKICANAIINVFKGRPVEPMPTANSACFSPISSTQASWLTAVYQYKTVDAGNNPLAVNKRFVIWDGVANQYAAGATEASAPSTGNFSKMGGWYKVLMAESFT